VCWCTEGVATIQGQEVWSEDKVEANYGGTRVQSLYELGEGMSEFDIMRVWYPWAGHEPQPEGTEALGGEDGGVLALTAMLAEAQTYSL
jgi:hypothetical protein